MCVSVKLTVLSYIFFSGIKILDYFVMATIKSSFVVRKSNRLSAKGLEGKVLDDSKKDDSIIVNLPSDVECGE